MMAIGNKINSIRRKREISQSLSILQGKINNPNYNKETFEVVVTLLDKLFTNLNDISTREVLIMKGRGVGVTTTLGSWVEYLCRVYSHEFNFIFFTSNTNKYSTGRNIKINGNNIFFPYKGQSIIEKISGHNKRTIIISDEPFKWHPEITLSSDINLIINVFSSGYQTNSFIKNCQYKWDALSSSKDSNNWCCRYYIPQKDIFIQEENS